MKVFGTYLVVVKSDADFCGNKNNKITRNEFVVENANLQVSSKKEQLHF